MILSPVEWTALGISLKVASAALVLMVIPGVPLAWLLARRKFPGRTLLTHNHDVAIVRRQLEGFGT